MQRSSATAGVPQLTVANSNTNSAHANNSVNSSSSALTPQTYNQHSAVAPANLQAHGQNQQQSASGNQQQGLLIARNNSSQRTASNQSNGASSSSSAYVQSHNSSKRHRKSRSSQSEGGHAKPNGHSRNQRASESQKLDRTAQPVSQDSQQQLTAPSGHVQSDPPPGNSATGDTFEAPRAVNPAGTGSTVANANAYSSSSGSSHPSLAMSGALANSNAELPRRPDQTSPSELNAETDYTLRTLIREHGQTDGTTKTDGVHRQNKPVTDRQAPGAISNSAYLAALQHAKDSLPRPPAPHNTNVDGHASTVQQQHLLPKSHHTHQQSRLPADSATLQGARSVSSERSTSPLRNTAFTSVSPTNATQQRSETSQRQEHSTIAVDSGQAPMRGTQRPLLSKKRSRKSSATSKSGSDTASTNASVNLTDHHHQHVHSGDKRYADAMLTPALVQLSTGVPVVTGDSTGVYASSPIGASGAKRSRVTADAT